MQKIQVLVPVDTVNLCDMALILRQLGRHKESVDRLSQALQLKPDSVKYLMELAVSFCLRLYGSTFISPLSTLPPLLKPTSFDVVVDILGAAWQQTGG